MSEGTPSRRDIRAKFGDDYVADARTYKMGINERFTKHIAERFAGKRVLETCTGGGFTTLALAREADHVITVEIDSDSQAQARRNVERAGLADSVTFVLGDVLEERTLKDHLPIDAAFLDPDWAEAGPGHIYRFRRSNTQPPADVLLDQMLAVTSAVAMVLPPQTDRREFEGLPVHECQRLYLGDNHALYCLYFGDLAARFGPTELRGRDTGRTT